MKDKKPLKTAKADSPEHARSVLPEPTHIDDWIDRPSLVIEGGSREAYARWVFEYFRLPAYKHSMYWPFMREHRLFCMFEGECWRVTGASRLGDVWLTRDYNQHTGYQRRVSVDGCSGWGPAPEKRSADSR